MRHTIVRGHSLPMNRINYSIYLTLKPKTFPLNFVFSGKSNNLGFVQTSWRVLM